MSTATDFIGGVYDTLAKTFGINNTSTDMFLQMAWPGYSLSPSDFKPANAPAGPYDPGVAEEVFSALANIAPTMNKVRFENPGFEIDDLYEILILSAIPVGATPETVGTNPVNRLFNDAQFDFSNFRRGSRSDPGAFYYPVVATPNNWYDETAAQFWPSIDIKSTDIQPQQPTSTFNKFGGATLASQSIWKLKPALNEVQVKAGLQTMLTARSAIATQKISSGTTITHTRSLNANIRTATLAVQPGAIIAQPLTLSPKPNVFVNPSALSSSMFSTALASARNSTMFTKKTVPVSSFASLINSSKLKDITVRQNFDVNTSPALNAGQAFVIQDLLNQQLVSKPLSPATNGFSISFKYCRVNMDRNWMNLALLNMRNWYMFGTAKSEYSTGTAENNPGMFPLLPTSFIVIRDLKITANWSQDDKDTFGKAAAFGPFDIRNSTFNQNTITVKGLQVISWISKLMPALPPAQV